ncbi:Uncharacterised protein [Clostridium paraputrificum]|nr:Uncharacterised protein [Clostridium paraputrificum]CUP96310.1 Uncharacterised protein [Clostridium paraputrificum]SQB91098.1 Uncharacterised protein [Clostridium paraputrificum]
MIFCVLLIGIICIVLLVNNVISILYKIRDNKNNTSANIFICCIALIYLWLSIIFLSSI